MKLSYSTVSRCAALAAVAVMVAACETNSVQPHYPMITFSHLAPVNLDVAAVEYVDQYVPPQDAPNVDHLFPVPPSTVAKREYIAARLRNLVDVSLVLTSEKKHYRIA